MDTGFKILINEIRELAQKYPDAVREETESVMREITARLEAEVARRTPAGVGGAAGLRGSIHGEVKSFGGSVTGVVGTPLSYGEVIEYGRRPGKFPPVAPIQLWVQRKLGLSAKDSRSVGFIVARKIAARGFPGAHMFGEAWKATEQWVMGRLQVIPGRVVQRGLS